MTVTALLGVLVAILSTTITVDKFLHAFGLSKLIAAQVRHTFDGAVEAAKKTPGTDDDDRAAVLQELAHKAGDAIDRGDEAAALGAVKDFAAKRAAK
jgi:hypothetical protein